jgi:hypothetical protein
MITRLMAISGNCVMPSERFQLPRSTKGLGSAGETLMIKLIRLCYQRDVNAFAAMKVDTLGLASSRSSVLVSLLGVRQR